MYCIIKCIVQRKQARVKNADLRHPSCTVVMQKRKSASPVLNVLSHTYFLEHYRHVQQSDMTLFVSLRILLLTETKRNTRIF